MSINLSSVDRDKLRAFQRSVDSYGAVPHPLTKDEIDRFIKMGLLEQRGVSVRLSPQGGRALDE